jgi:hypothetical protein
MQQVLLTSRKPNSRPALSLSQNLSKVAPHWREKTTVKFIFIVCLGICFSVTAMVILGGLRIVVVPAVSFSTAPATLVVFNAPEFHYIDSPIAASSRRAFPAEDCEEAIAYDLLRNTLFNFPFSPWLHDFAMSHSPDTLLDDAVLRS